MIKKDIFPIIAIVATICGNAVSAQENADFLPKNNTNETEIVKTISAYEYNCIACTRNDYYYCEYSSSYNTGNCDSTSFYWCTT